MGASGWYYVVPYQPDIAGALRQLRQEVYNRGEYYREDLSWYFRTTEEELRAQLNPDQWDSGLNDAILEDWREAQRRPTPVDPDTVFAAQPHSGTHSIIDMAHGVAATPRMYTVSPLTNDELLDLVGTTQPTAEQFRRYINGHGGNRRGWVGTYVVTYLDGQPHEIHFYGISGD